MTARRKGSKAKARPEPAPPPAEAPRPPPRPRSGYRAPGTVYPSETPEARLARGQKQLSTTIPVAAHEALDRLVPRRYATRVEAITVAILSLESGRLVKIDEVQKE